MPAQPPFAVGAQNTQLNQLEEMAFRQWLAENRVPFDPEAAQTDYDMRGFWRAQQQQNPMATSVVSPNDNRMHYPDYWKTPQHQSFSAESQFAGPEAPQWVSDSMLAAPSGRVIKNERAPESAIVRALMGKQAR